MKFFHLAMPFLCWLVSCSSPGPVSLSAFTSDGCSGFPDGTRIQPMLWNACCLEHDIAYWLGGSRTDRLRADEALHECLNKYDLPVSAFLVKKNRPRHRLRLPSVPFPLGVWLAVPPRLPQSRSRRTHPCSLSPRGSRIRRPRLASHSLKPC